MDTTSSDQSEHGPLDELRRKGYDVTVVVEVFTQSPEASRWAKEDYRCSNPAVINSDGATAGKNQCHTVEQIFQRYADEIAEADYIYLMRPDAHFHPICADLMCIATEEAIACLHRTEATGIHCDHVFVIPQRLVRDFIRSLAISKS